MSRANFNALLRLHHSIISCVCDSREASTSHDVGTPVRSNDTWPYPYVLPSMPPVLEKALRMKDKRLVPHTKSSLRTQLVQCLLDDIVKKAGW